MKEQLPKLLPVSILITSFNRLELLKKTIRLINERTFYPFRIIVIDNNSVDGSVDYLKNAKVNGYIFDHIFLEENIGQSQALNKGFKLVEWWENEHRRPSNDFIISSNEDIFPPMLGQENCWLTQMIDILERNEPEYGGICQRIQRTPRNEIDEKSEIIYCPKGFPSVFRLMRRSDLRGLGDDPFGKLRKWDSNTSGDKYKTQIKKKYGFTTHIYADHAGFELENKGFIEGIETFTVAANKLNERNDKPYPDIDPLTNEPIKVNHGCDTREQSKREEYKQETEGRYVGPEVTMLILTYKRIDGLKRIVDSIKRTVSPKEPAYKFLIMIDNDDTASYDYCVENGLPCLLANTHNDFVKQANIGMYACESPYVAKFDDDMSITESGWLTKSLSMFKEKFPDGSGIVAFDDDLSNGAVFTTGLISKRVINDLGGHLFFPLFKHFGGDRETVRLAKELGKYHFTTEIKVNHYHPDHKNQDLVNEDDETYGISKNKFWRFDQDLKHYRQKNIDILKEKNYCDYAK